MDFNAENPINIVIDDTFKNLITTENWPGKTSVEFHYADHVSDYHLHLSDGDVLIALDFTKETAAVSGSLKLIQRFGAGMDKIDFAAIPKGCSVCNCHEHEKPIAEWVVMSMIGMDSQRFPCRTHSGATLV